MKDNNSRNEMHRIKEIIETLDLTAYSNYIRNIRGKKREPINVEDIECILLAKRAIEEKISHEEILLPITCPQDK